MLNFLKSTRTEKK